MSISELDLEMDKRKMKVMCDEGDSPLHAETLGIDFCSLSGHCLKLHFQ